jgi:hypothetical protein
MGWRAARPSFFLRPWQGAVIAAAVMAVATSVQAQGEFCVRAATSPRHFRRQQRDNLHVSTSGTGPDCC